MGARREGESSCIIVKHAIFFCLLLFCATSQATTPFPVTDVSGTQLVFITPPQRIISLAPNLTELAYAAGMSSHIVAVTAYSDYPQQAKQLPQVGDAFRLDWERLVALKPDLVLAWGSGLSSRDRATFEKLKLKVLVLEPRRLDDIPKVLRLLGRVAGTEPAAEAAAHAFVEQLDTLRRQYAGRTKVRAYFQIAAAPLLTVNDAHIISDVLRLCGAQNVFAAVPLLTPAISNEALVKENPQVMLAVAATYEQEEETKRIWRELPLIAVRQGRMVFIHPDLISRSTPRILLGAKRICEQIESARH
ncbi:Vitamin B12 ABC transporter, B12-binding component BtuF [Candidatus Nitrotoga arctica]|uniref:Vitamin B12 ABC transporter, B12-binding component BtuF n=1 Tax=Candidatus Nitrotoga arctica TaxID=453162 RepID=A0ABM8Z163_9PROT|nr:Vitamin B12 ABC transporter, B12-binding component BtuF [Candidatus Nitrotoga arctica]